MKRENLNGWFARSASLVAGLLLVAGCAGVAERVETSSQQTAQQIERARREAIAAFTERKQRAEAAQEVDKPYIAGRPVPLDRAAGMLPHLRVVPTVLFDAGAVDLGTALMQLSKASGVQIAATQDALMPASAFAPRMSVAVKQADAKVSLAQLPSNAPLWLILDEVCRQAHVSWRPAGSGVEVYRVSTRVFEIAAVPATVKTKAAMGRAGGKSEAFTTNTETSFEFEASSVKALQTAVENLLTIGGRAVLTQDGQSLVVTDTPAALQRVEEFVNAQNRQLTRRVRVLVEAYELMAKDSAEVGIDWSLLFNGTKFDLGTSAPRSLAGELGGGISVTGVSGKWAGSRLTVQALSEVAHVVGKRSFPFLTTSGRPVTYNLYDLFTYVDESRPAVITPTTVTPPSATQKEETVGTFMTVTPVARGDGQITLQLAWEDKTADPLVPFTPGTGSAAVIVQQKRVHGRSFLQEVPMRSGHTVMVGGIESLFGQQNNRRLAPSAPMLFGGSDRAGYERSQMVLFITALVEEDI